MLCVLYVVATGGGFSLFVHFVCLFANKVSLSSHGYPGTPSVEETDLCLLAESWIKSICHCCLKAMVVYLPQEKLKVAYCPLAPSLILSLLQSKFEGNPWSRLASFSSGNPSILRRESEVGGWRERGEIPLLLPSSFWQTAVWETDCFFCRLCTSGVCARMCKEARSPGDCSILHTDLIRKS